MSAGLDGVGLALVASGATWAVVSSIGRDGARPLPTVAAYALIAACFVAARRLHRHDPRLPGAVVVAVGGVSLTIGVATLLLAGGEPLGYANANSTLFGLTAVGAALMVVRVDRQHRLPAAGFAVGFTVGMLVAGSAAAAGAFAAAILIALVARGWAAPLGMAAMVGVVALTALFTVRTDDPPASLDTRVALWREAHRLLDEEPLRGVGAGAFEEHNRVSNDDDLRWAHNEYLQTGAEQGAIGLLLLLMLLGWAMLRCSTATGPLSVRSLGVAAVVFVALHSSVDYVLHFWPVTATTAFLVGATSAPRPARPREARVARGILGSPLLRR
jgi:O-antigen ligase